MNWRNFGLMMLLSGSIGPWVATVHGQNVQPDSLRIALIGLDHPNAELFAQRLNNPADPSHVSGGRIVAAFTGASPEDESIAARVTAVTAVLRDKYGVRIAESLQDAISSVDAVLLLGTDPSLRLDQASTAIAAGKPLFIANPAAASLTEVVEIFKLAEAANTPVFTASPLRWSAGISELITAGGGKTPAGVLGSGVAPFGKAGPMVFGESIHLVSGLISLMGSECESVSCVSSPQFSTIVGIWPDGRMGSLVFKHEGTPSFKMSRIDGEPGTEQKLLADPTPLLREIVKFFQSRQAPVSRNEALSIYAVAEAANKSRGNKGTAINVQEVLKTSGAPDAWFSPPVDPSSD